MDQVQSEKMMAEMNAFLEESGDASVSGNEKPEAEELPFESLDDYSTDPMEFGELAERMSVKVETIFDLSVMYNRHSPKYLKACAMLEKGIKYLACCCITRVALKEQDDVNAGPNDLSVEKLYRMVSFNYRKLDTAHTEKLAQSCELYPELTDMVFRYFNLLLRLRTTEAKIFSYNFKAAYKTKDYTPAMQGLAFTPKSWNNSFNDLRPDREPVFHRAPSFPVLRDVVDTETKTARRSASVSHTKAKTLREAAPVVTEGETVNAEPVPAEKLPALPPASEGFKADEASAPEIEETGAEGTSNGEAAGMADKTPTEKEEQLPENGTKPAGTPMIRELPNFREILQAAGERSGRAEEGCLEFTIMEMVLLNADSEFRACYPDLAADIRRELMKMFDDS